MSKIWQVLMICVLAGCSSSKSANPVSRSNIPPDSVATVSNMPPSIGTPVAKDDFHPHVRPKNFGQFTKMSHSPEERAAFEQYDKEMLNNIQQHWYELLASDPIKKKKLVKGTVVVGYRLHFDGQISEVKVVSRDVDDLLAYVCLSAISDLAPYASWSPEMRKMIGSDFRDIRFTFYFE
jgi:hypothetical protein